MHNIVPRALLSVTWFLLVLSRTAPGVLAGVLAYTLVPHTPDFNVTNSIAYLIESKLDGQKHQWKITNPTSVRVCFIFEIFSMNSAEVQISERTPEGSDQIIFKCPSCGEVIPPYFESTSPLITILAFGVLEAVSFKKSFFTLRYTNILPASDPALLALNYKFNMGYAHIVPTLLSNGKLPARAIQTWRINTQGDQASGNIIKFSLSDMLFSSSCLATLNIYDSDDSRNLLYSGCQSSDQQSEWLYSATGKAYVVLDNSAQAEDTFTSFKLTYLGEKDLYNCGSMDFAWDTLTSTSAFISDGSRPSFDNNGKMRASMDCKFVIQPTEGNPDDKITLVFNWVSLKQGSQVIVYDHHNSSGAILWDSGQQLWSGDRQGRCLTEPPPIISSRKALYVRYISDGSNDQDYHGFYGEYFLNKASSAGMGSGLSQLAMSSAIDLTLPGDQTSYATSFRYKFNIVPQSIIAGSKIWFVVNNINLPNAEDTLIIYDGAIENPANIIVQLTGTTVPITWYQTVSDQALVVFDSKVDASNLGSIKLNYFADGPNYHCGFTRNPAVLTAPSMAIFDGSASNAVNYQGQNCQWLVNPPNSRGVFLFFLYFGVMGGALEIYSDEYNPKWGYWDVRSKLVATIRNTLAVPAPLFLPYAKIGLKYTTGSAMTDASKPSGFKAYYYRQSSDRSVKSMPGDGIIRLYSSSMTLLDNYEEGGYIPSNLNLTYSVAPLSAASPYIYFSFGHMNLTCGHAAIKIYDGASTASPLLGTFCGDSLKSLSKKWITTSTAKATLTFTSDASPNQSGNFKLSYYSNGPNSHCGFNINPGVMSSQSMVFTDGSSYSENMYNNQACLWQIQPDVGEDGSDGGGFVALEFLYNELRGGFLEIYKNNAATPANLLWKCYECSLVPRPIVSDSGNMLVRFWTNNAAQVQMGRGFKAVYWSTNRTIEQEFTHQKKSGGLVMEAPPGVKIIADSKNDTLGWRLGFGKLDGVSSSSVNSIKFSPRIESSVSLIESQTRNKIRDGRQLNKVADYQPVTSATAYSCGMLVGNESAILSDDLFGLRTTQWARAYMVSKAAGVTIHDSSPNFNTGQGSSADARFEPAKVCKYILDTNSQQAIRIIGSHTRGQSRLRIWGGKWGNDALIFDSNQPRADQILETGVVAPCGQSLILLELNETLSTTVNHALQLSYYADAEVAMGAACVAYYISLLPVIEVPDPWIPYYIALGTCLGMCCLFFTFMYLRKLSSKYYPENGCNPFKRIKIYKIVTPRHLTYTPKWDLFRNKFLGKGECAICQDVCKVFKLKPCGHKMCPEDMAGYLGAALGDISLFPVKCPLHYEGCTSTIDARIAKRVLDKIQFGKFNEFSDRSKYGEGMRCIFCNNYVNFPEEGKFSMVECPYCIQTFCIRCKKPWHFGSKCPLDGIDDSLDRWKQESGAAKCPACSKLIEKSDVETCNHMIHKITDGIPCIKDRTDFCYCCGEEVESEYPHDEVKRPGVNHFPDGVYQKCRTVMQRERDSERDRLKRLRRMKKSPDRQREIGFSGLEIGKDGHVATDDEGWEKIPDYLLTSEREARGADARLGDAFDQQWDNEMATAKIAAKGEMSDSDDDENGVVDLGQTVPSASGRHGVPRYPEREAAPLLAPETPTTATRTLAAPGRNMGGGRSGGSTPQSSGSSPPRMGGSGSGSPTATAPYGSPSQQVRNRPTPRNVTPVAVPPRGRARVSPGPNN